VAEEWTWTHIHGFDLFTQRVGANLFFTTMTEVYTISSPTPEFGTSPLQRTTSQTSFFHQSSYSRSPTRTRTSPYSNLGYEIRVPPSVPSSAPSSPRLQHPDFSNQPSYTSTPSSSLSLNETCETENDDILFPSYGESLSRGADGTSEPPSSPEIFPTEDSTIEGEIPYRSPPVLSNLDAADTPQIAGDDTAIRVEPTRHVDYLSHEWKEEDIWSSWRHIVAKRNVYSNSVRLENASWRTWAKSKNRLKTISPESLNWYVLFSLDSISYPRSCTNILQDEGPRRDMVVRPSANW
jgi:hypothetical protein